MEILAKFDSDGRKISAVREGWHFKNSSEKQKFLDDGFIPITEEENFLYTASYIGDNETGYLRDRQTGKPVSAPPQTISPAQKAEQLKEEYSAELEDLKSAMVTAILNEDSDLQKDLREEYSELLAEYKSKLETEENGES